MFCVFVFALLLRTHVIVDFINKECRVYRCSFVPLSSTRSSSSTLILFFFVPSLVVLSSFLRPLNSSFLCHRCTLIERTSKTCVLVISHTSGVKL